MIELSDERVIFAFSKDAEPVLTVDSGETVRIHAQDCFSNQIQSYDDTIDGLDWDRVNPATGPIYVRGAKKGGMLKVHIDAIEVGRQGICCTGKDEGVYGDRLNKWGMHICPIDHSTNEVVWDDRLRLPYKPMIGVIGVAPEGEPVSCGTPDAHGGNMDNNQITAGATLWFPVNVDGALFGLGDMHAAMGDGEVGVSGAEIDGYATVTLTAEPELSFDTPLFEDADSFGVIYSAPTLDEAADGAVHRLVDLVADRTGRDQSELVQLFSIAANVGVCQMVDPLRTTRFTVPKRVLEALDFTL